jgi:hypothetical protein
LEVVETYEGKADKKEEDDQKEREWGNAMKRPRVLNEVAWGPLSISKLDERRMEVFD